MVEKRRFRYSVESRFDLRLVLFGHGWIDLEPFSWSEDDQQLMGVLPIGRKAVDFSLRQSSDALVATVASQRALTASEAEKARALVPRMLRLDEELGEFWAICERTPRLSWVAARGGGRIFRCPSVFEDLMKLLFTTNCSWAATKLMTSRLIAALGPKAPSGRRAFPSAATCAAQDESFYREVVRAGYRAVSCIGLAKKFATGEVDEAWFTDRALHIDDVRERLLALPGFGPYAAGQAMRTLGHYKDLALDSWCRARLAKMAGKKKPPSDKTVARRYASFHPYDGLALWMDLTAEWHGEG